MSASLVGSEMCIRDSHEALPGRPQVPPLAGLAPGRSRLGRGPRGWCAVCRGRPPDASAARGPGRA
eukprot:3019342-Alexandrium_andersonii.AAC.1